MENLTFEQLQALIGIATKKEWYEVAALVAPIGVAFLALWVSVVTLMRHSKHVKNEKVIEKEVEKLYEAVDCFFEYTDAVGLYFSMQEKKYRRTLALEADDEGFAHKVNEATDAVYSNFNKVRKTSFLLRALGEKDIAEKVDAYREESIDLRKKFYELSQSPSKEKIEAFLEGLKEETAILEAKKVECLDGIAACKGRIKGSDG